MYRRYVRHVCMTYQRIATCAPYKTDYLTLAKLKVLTSGITGMYQYNNAVPNFPDIG